MLVSSASRVRNFPFVSVTVCAPNSGAKANCFTVDNVVLDTGSYGLRLFASAIAPATLGALPLRVDAASGQNTAACAVFGSGHTWGSLRKADVQLGGEIAQAVPIQVVSDPAIRSSAPPVCAGNTALDSPGALGANGILGVGVARYDCGMACLSDPGYGGYYYADTTPKPTPIAMPLAEQVVNPVALFPVDNNGLIVQMPQVADAGARSVEGLVIFGIDTQPNNALAGKAATIMATSDWGDFDGNYNGASKVTSFIDSGSNALNFDDGTLPQNKSFFYSPATPQQRSVVISSNGISATVTLNIANATTLFASPNYAFNNLAAAATTMVDLGLPFFYGRSVWYGIVGTSSKGAGAGPYVAFTAL